MNDRRVPGPASSERLRVEKARLRIVLDRRLGRETPPQVKELAKKQDQTSNALRPIDAGDR